MHLNKAFLQQLVRSWLNSKLPQRSSKVNNITSCCGEASLTFFLELQLQYTNYKNNLQQLAQKIGDVEQETEEHKYVYIVSVFVPTRNVLV